MSDTFHDAYGQEIELTSEQTACLKYTGNRTLMVKGYAGAGKSNHERNPDRERQR